MNTRTAIFLSSCLVLACFVPTIASGAIQSKTVEYKDGDVTLKGYLAWDDAIKGKRPGVLVVHEWWGLNDFARNRAEALAKLGYVAFAADMYGKGQVTEHPAEAKTWMEQITTNQNAWLRRSMVALDVLRGQPLVDPGRLAAIGYCFGGATVMQLAYAGADLKGVVSFHGSLPVAGENQKGKIKAQILAANGAADAFVPPDQVLAFQKGLEDAGATWEMAIYGGAHHGFTNPDASRYNMENVVYNARAATDSWNLMISFFIELFAGK